MENHVVRGERPDGDIVIVFIYSDDDTSHFQYELSVDRAKKLAQKLLKMAKEIADD